MGGWGWNPLEVPGGAIGDGSVGRITDPVTGAGLFNPNMDPAVVGIDPLTGSEAPVGTDMSFGAMVRRQVQTNVINGDFAVLPPSGADTLIVSSPDDSLYNPLPGWTWAPDAGGLTTAVVTADAAYASGYKVRMTATGNPSDRPMLTQFIPVPRTQGQQFRVLPSIYGSTTGAGVIRLWYAWALSDTTTLIRPEVNVATLSGVSGEAKGDAGLIPPTASYLRLRVEFDPSAAATGDIGEVRVAFLPVEAEVGLKSITANVGPISNGEDVVVQALIPATSLTVGSTYRLRAFGTITSTATAAVTLRARIGTSSLSGNIIASRGPTANNTASVDPFEVEALVTVRSIGASGTIIGGIRIMGNASQPFNAQGFVGDTGSTVTVDTTVANWLELTAATASANTSVTFHVATIECVMAS